jgi:uncharacterized protein (TIGR03435 family)
MSVTLIKQRRMLVRLAFAAALTAGVIRAQSPAPGKIEFDVASVKPSKSNDLPSNSSFPLGPGSAYLSSGGHFSAVNFPLATYLAFAYEVMGYQQESLLSQLPRWATTEHFDIQAQTDGSPAKDTKDQMRLMMRSLLADRFKLALHFETRQEPLFGLIALKPGRTGPLLQPHPNDSPCPTIPPAQPNQPAGSFPAVCGGISAMPPSGPGLVRFGARNVTMPFVASMLTSMGGLDRPILDQTGLAGNFDFALEWVFRPRAADPPADLPGPLFMDALREQLGLKLESQKGPVEVLVLEHVERPSQN